MVQGFKRVHFIGVGGVGMSGIARVLHQRGFEVSGSDLKASKYTRKLQEEGLEIYIGHSPANLEDSRPDIIVISSAIPESNPELKAAHEAGIPVYRRAQMLAELARGRKTIAFAGTHGKTTSSSMAASSFDRMGLEPTFLIGGSIDGYDTNGNNGAGEFFICEADESDGSFLYLDPSIVVVSNIEADHLDHYSGLDEIKEIFKKFMASVGPDGTIIVCGDDEELLSLARQAAFQYALCAQEHKAQEEESLQQAHFQQTRLQQGTSSQDNVALQNVGPKVLSYGFAQHNDVVCSLRPRIDEANLMQSCFSLSFPDASSVELHIDRNPGIHNVLNASSVMCAAYACGLDMQKAAEALSSFSGVRRRFDYVGSFNGVTIVDDYGHHPTEIAATLKAAASLNYKHLRVVFQPHRYTRTQAFAKDFGRAFDEADSAIFMDVYAAGESPIPGITGKTLIREIQARLPHKDLAYFPSRPELIDYLLVKCEPGDLLLTMGAGDVTSIGPALLEHYEKARDTHE